MARDRLDRKARARLTPRGIVIIVAVIFAAAAWKSVFTVDESQDAIVTDFGRPTQIITTPGLGFKYPYQSLQVFDRRVFVYAAASNEFLTLEKTPVVAAGTVLWRVGDPKRYFETVAERSAAESRLGDVLYAELGAAIGRTPIATFVSVAFEGDQADRVMAEVTARCRAVAFRDYGIEVVDVQLAEFDFPKQSRARLYARMKSERGRISMQYRSEGEESGLKVRAGAEEEKGRILAGALESSLRVRGDGDAAAAGLYGEALGQAPDFFAFLRSLDAARLSIGKDATLVLPADSPLFGPLHDSDYFAGSPGGPTKNGNDGRKQP
jgi:modulator of FtsH protease HflC